MRKDNNSNTTKLCPADALHITFFAVLTAVSAIFHAKSILHFLVSLWVNGCIAHVLSRLVVASKMSVRGIPSRIHLFWGIMSLAYIIPSWFKIHFPLQSLGLLQENVLLGQVDLYYRIACYVGQMIILCTGQIIMLTKSTRTPWDVMQGLSITTQTQFGGMMGYFILLTYSLDDNDDDNYYYVLGIRYFLAAAATVSILIATIMTVIGAVQIKKYDKMKKEDGENSPTTTWGNEKKKHSQLSLTDMLLGVFLDPTKYGQTLEPEIPPNAKQAADTVLIIVVVSQGSSVLNLFNLLTGDFSPLMMNPILSFYMSAAVDAFILCFMSAVSFDITLAFHKKITTMSNAIPLGMALLSLACWAPLANIVLHDQDATDFSTMWKQMYWPMFGSVE